MTDTSTNAAAVVTTSPVEWPTFVCRICDNQWSNPQTDTCRRCGASDFDSPQNIRKKVLSTGV